MKKFLLDGSSSFKIHGSICECQNFKGVVIIVHGMCEYQNRYYDFMNFLCLNGYIAVIYDLRGHGEYVNKCDLGFIGEKDVLIDDLNLVVEYMKKLYPNVPTFIFSHSMGTLVARNYIEKYDDCINKLIMSGPPTKNNLVDFGIFLASIYDVFNMSMYRSKFINGITFSSYNKGSKIPNSWLSSDSEVVKKYNSDDLCGFIFTVNGFSCLFYMLKNAFVRSNYSIKNSDLDILLLAGSLDPVVGGSKKFDSLYNFFKEIGYSNIKKEWLIGMKHEILNEVDSGFVYSKVLKFIDDKKNN